MEDQTHLISIYRTAFNLIVVDRSVKLARYNEGGRRLSQRHHKSVGGGSHVSDALYKQVIFPLLEASMIICFKTVCMLLCTQERVSTPVCWGIYSAIQTQKLVELVVDELRALLCVKGDWVLWHFPD